MNVQNKILITLATKSLVTKKSLLLLADTERTGYRALKKLESNNLIKEHKLEYKKLSRKYLTDYYTITWLGIKHLREQNIPEEPWIKYLPDDVTRLSIMGGRTGITRVLIDRYLRITTAAVICEEATGNRTIVFFDKLGEGKGKGKNKSEKDLGTPGTEPDEKSDPEQENEDQELSSAGNNGYDIEDLLDEYYSDEADIVSFDDEEEKKNDKEIIEIDTDWEEI